MDQRLLELERRRTQNLVKELRDLGEVGEGQPFLAMVMQSCLETLQIIQAELQSEFDSRPRKALGRSIKSSITGGRPFKDKLRGMQQVNNVMDSLKVSRLSMKAEHSEASLKHLEQKIDTLMEQQKQQFEILDVLHQDSYVPAAKRSHMHKMMLRSDDSSISNSLCLESDEDDILQKLSTLSIMGLDILADVLEREDYFELSNRLRVWGLGIVDGPLAIGKLDIFTGSSSRALEVFSAPFLRILSNIEPNGSNLLAFLEESEELINSVTSKDPGRTLAINGMLKLAGVKDIAKGISACTKSISNEIETLFEPLPGIRSERKTVLSARAQGIKPYRTPDTQKRLLAEETVEVARDLTNLLLQKAREETPKKEKSLTEHISGLFEEETQRLAEWAKSQPGTTNEIATELIELKDSLLEKPPGIPRVELKDLKEKKDRGWEFYRGMPNWSGRCDIPRGAVLHNSLKERLEKVESYNPSNNHGSGEPSLRNAKGDC
ncbi:hypothetical protein FVEG_17427 [Fusarium verticillioides 7600]|uniref:Uncharacterized protein n=1 Tax=Gibberella moniliformis (strain M3125 / FGSC 7600) TaxID=334819 RepID=W7MUV0_GIBM7|nr:hypothetical protein FVEG_17427 [Fusarium verticillioides 7600]EWG54941.1 hypothetical protein FVEG_17427 [Fusarium verticillioides 7600]